MIKILAIVLILILACGDLDRHRHGWPMVFKVGLFAVLAIIIGIRIDVGIDYDAYVSLYNHPTGLRAQMIEPIWGSFILFLRTFTHNPQLFFLICAFLTMGCYYKGIERLSPAFYLSTLFFIITGLYFETANTVRQCAAQSILLWGYDYWVQRKWKVFAIFCFCAFMLHYSAFLGIILIMISGLNIRKGVLIAMLVITALFGSTLMDFAVDRIMPFFISNGMYNYDTDQFDDGISSGALKYIYCAIGIFLILVCTKDESGDRKKILSMLRMVIYGFCIYNTFYTFQPARRLYTYGFMFIIILLPYFFSMLRPSIRYMALGIIVAIFTALLIKQTATVPYFFEFVYL